MVWVWARIRVRVRVRGIRVGVGLDSNWARLWVVLTPIAEPTPLPSNSKTSSQTGSSDLAWVSVRRISLPRKSFRYGSLLSTLPS